MTVMMIVVEGIIAFFLVHKVREVAAIDVKNQNIPTTHNNTTSNPHLSLFRNQLNAHLSFA